MSILVQQYIHWSETIKMIKEMKGTGEKQHVEFTFTEFAVIKLETLSSNMTILYNWIDRLQK